MKFRRSLAPQIFFLLSTVVFRLLFPLQYYFSFSGEPLWKLTSENRWNFQGDFSNKLKHSDLPLGTPPSYFWSPLLIQKSSKLGLADGWKMRTECSSSHLLGMDSWILRSIPSFVSRPTMNGFCYGRSPFYLKPPPSRAKALFSYYALPLHADWIVLLQDDSLVLIDQLKYVSSLWNSLTFSILF